jgi:hypothetical protein
MLDGDRGALALGPAREFVGAGQVESVEERAVVEIHGALVFAAREGGRKLRDVARGERRIQPQILRADYGFFHAEIAAQRIERLRQRARTALVVGVGPQEAQQLFARDAPLAGARE